MVCLLEGIIFQFSVWRQCPLAFHLPPIKAELLSPRSHLPLTSSRKIHYLIHLVSPCILLSQISSMTSNFSSPERTCKQSNSSRKKHTNVCKHSPQTLLDTSIISLGIDCWAVSRKEKICGEGRKKENWGAEGRVAGRNMRWQRLVFGSTELKVLHA